VADFFRARRLLSSPLAKAQRPPGSPLDQYLTLDIDSARDESFGKLCATVRLERARTGSIDGMVVSG
jgi:hypothetical protein